MPVLIEEYEPGIVLKSFSNSWTLEELVASRDEEIQIAKKYDGVVDVIADMSSVNRIPFNLAQAVQTFLQLDWDYINMWAVVSSNGLVRRVVVQIVQRSPLRGKVYFVNNEEEARKIIYQKRATQHPSIQHKAPRTNPGTNAATGQ